MGIDTRTISLWDTLRLQLVVAVPAFLWGLVAPNRFFVACLCRWNAGQWTVRLLRELREKYQCDHLWAWFPFKRTLLVLNQKSIDAVLHSKDNAADPALKKRALSGFVPDALVIASGGEWADRRSFNESALDLGRLHRHADAFRDIAYQEIASLPIEHGRVLRWADFERLAQRISQQVVLGAGQLNPEMAMHLARLVKRSNWAFLPRHRRNFSAFYQQVEADMAHHAAFHGESDAHRRQKANSESAPARCLMHESARLLNEGRTTPSTQVPRQIGFWFFVLKDAVELHVARTLALIAAHPDIQDRVREEIRRAPALSTQEIDGYRYLETCIEEQLRLWTPVPILLRRAVKPFSLPGDISIAADEQILIHAGAYHRDARVFGEIANQFAPDSVNKTYPPVYFFSAHVQSCAGESLARFLLKATLASLLARFRFELVAPGIRPGQIPYLYDHFKIAIRAHQSVIP